MTRPTLPELAKARAELQRFLAANPEHELAPVLRVMLRSTAPLTKEEAAAVMAQSANDAIGFPATDNDIEYALDALNEDERGSWYECIRAQWATLVHFYGGAE